MIFETYREDADRRRQGRHSADLRLHNEIPLGMGCGSSAAALLAGVILANHFGGLGWDRPAMLDEACRREGHPDNVAACWLGCMTASSVGRMRSVITATCGQNLNWKLLLALALRQPVDREGPRAAARRPTPARTPSRTCRAPRCWSPPLRWTAPSCSASPCRTASTSPTAWRPARFSRCFCHWLANWDLWAWPSAEPARGPADRRSCSHRLSRSPPAIRYAAGDPALEIIETASPRRADLELSQLVHTA